MTRNEVTGYFTEYRFDITYHTTLDAACIGDHRMFGEMLKTALDVKKDEPKETKGRGGKKRKKGAAKK